MSYLLDYLEQYIDNLRLTINYNISGKGISSNIKSTPLYLMIPRVGQKYSLLGIKTEIRRRKVHLPNSISKIEECLTDPYRSSIWGIVKVKEDHYAVNSFSIFKYNTSVLEPCMILVTDSKIIGNIVENKENFSEVVSESFLDKDYLSGKQKIKNLSLIISKEFIESDSGKSLYNRLNKSFLPSLLENNVEIKIVSKDYILKNVFNPFQRKFTPLEQRSFEKMVTQEVERRLIENVF